MKITVKNLQQEWDGIKSKLSKDLIDIYEMSIKDGIKFYGEIDEEFDTTVDEFISQVNDSLKDDEPKPKAEPKPKKEPKVKKSKGYAKLVDDYSLTEKNCRILVGDYLKYSKNKKNSAILDEIECVLTDINYHSLCSALTEGKGAIDREFKDLYNVPYFKPKKETKAKEPQKEDTAEKVSKILPEVAFIKRYSNLHGKSVSQCKDKARNLLSSLQKAIIEKVVRKTSPYAKEIMDIQTSLLKLLKEKSGQINITNIEHYKEIAASQKVMPCAALVKSFIGIQGKTGVKEKAQNLLVKISNFEQKTPSDYPYKSEVAKIKRSLNNYIKGNTDTPEINSQTLAGLYGLAGVECNCKSGTAVGSQQFLANVFTPMNFTGKWLSLIGNPTEPFRIMIYGKPGSGKSTLALKLANYIAKNQNHKVLFVANEEGFGYTFQEKIKRLNVAHPNLSIIDKLPVDVYAYDVIFIDSVNSIGLESEDLRKLKKDKSWVYVFQTTKDGNFRGSQEFLHDVDTSIIVEDMKAISEKNRFGGKGEITV